MNTEISSRKIIKWDINNLTPHPIQATLFPTPPSHEIAELAATIKKGLDHPVEILPNGTILAGHKRIAAAKLLGWTEIEVWVRDDLADDPAAAEKRLIEDNLVRRQLSPLETARCYQQLKKIEHGNGGRRHTDRERQDLRDAIGTRLGKSGRTLDRYLRALDTPQEVQNAVAAGKLAVTVAEKVAGLSGERREQIATEIRAGGKPKEVVRRHLAAAPRPLKNATQLKEILVAALERGVTDLNGRVDEVRRITSAEEKTLGEAQRLINDLENRAAVLRKEKAAHETMLDA
jgi:ParB family chromosome partitioning protein